MLYISSLGRYWQYRPDCFCRWIPGLRRSHFTERKPGSLYGDGKAWRKRSDHSPDTVLWLRHCGTGYDWIGNRYIL